MKTTLTTGLKNWKTTIIGIALAVLLIMQESKDLTNIQDWLFPALIAALGILSRDANKTSEQSGIVPLLLGCFLCLTFVSCAAKEYLVDTSPYTNQIAVDPTKVVMSNKHVKPLETFQFEGSVSVETDYGNIGVGKDGINSELVVDLTSNK